MKNSERQLDGSCVYIEKSDKYIMFGIVKKISSDSYTTYWTDSKGDTFNSAAFSSIQFFDPRSIGRETMWDVLYYGDIPEIEKFAYRIKYGIA